MDDELKQAYIKTLLGLQEEDNKSVLLYVAFDLAVVSLTLSEKLLQNATSDVRYVIATGLCLLLASAALFFNYYRKMHLSRFKVADTLLTLDILQARNIPVQIWEKHKIGYQVGYGLRLAGLALLLAAYLLFSQKIPEPDSCIPKNGHYPQNNSNIDNLNYMDTDTAKKIFAQDRYAALTGVEIVEVQAGYCKARLTIEDKHMNAANVVQGGAIFTLADLAFAVASNSHGQLALAINVNISFLKSATTGSLTAVASEVTEPGRLGAYDVLVRDDQGELIARFNGMVYRKNQQLPGLAS